MKIICLFRKYWQLFPPHCSAQNHTHLQDYIIFQYIFGVFVISSKGNSQKAGLKVSLSDTFKFIYFNLTSCVQIKKIFGTGGSYNKNGYPACHIYIYFFLHWELTEHAFLNFSNMHDAHNAWMWCEQSLTSEVCIFHIVWMVFLWILRLGYLGTVQEKAID